ncbi:hypothetical protein E1176_16775 [Fulvivirga sp. RKSG066]|uniref:hypothetical protein n=1 Tax=Fulvivirga aurantia TaxID=2529383 RepID=UPI0012BD7A24|nr:hypothetical protein [Fulvivirga aurantia]MTI22689.1 hypothetical protein [Fulvivirga aurantia]
MKKILLCLFILALYWSSFAQSDSIRIRNAEAKIEAIDQNLSTAKSDLTKLQEVSNRLSRNVNDIKLSGQTTDSRLDSLQVLLLKNRQSIEKLSESIASQKTELTGQIQKTGQSASQRIESLDESLNKNTLYWIIAVLAVGLITLGLFFMLRKRVSDNQSSIVENISSTRKQLEQEGIWLDEKLIGIMETQLKVIQEEETSSSSSSKPDHLLALKLADEIVRIEKNICQMDEGTKGLKQLAKAVERIRDNFASNGYEMVDMLGKTYEEGLKASVTFRPDPDMDEEVPVITRIIKPQINYRGVMVQQAQIEVSQPE